MPSTAAIGRVIDTLRAEFPLLRKAEITADTALLSAGLLDSFAIVALLAVLERVFAIELDVESLQLEQLETPATIAAFCEAQAGGRSG